MSDEKSLKTLTMAVYLLQALGFFVGITWIVAVIIDYVKKEEAAGSWLESHFRWQIRTFWFGLLRGLVGGGHLAHLPHRQGLALPQRQQALAYLRKRTSSG